MKTVERMIEEIRLELSQGEELEDITDRANEFTDSYLPIYYNDIIEEWRNMPSEYNDRGYAELDAGGEVIIYNLMSLDLYLYYSDLFAEAIRRVEESLEEAI